MDRFSRSIGAMLGGILLVACVEEIASVDPSVTTSVRLTVSEARAAYEMQLSRGTRSGDAADDLLLPGAYVPLWDAAAESVGDALYSVDVPVVGGFAYVWACADDDDSLRFAPMYPKLVVVRDGASEATACYLRYFLPTPEDASCHTAAYYDALLNSDPKEDFTGLSVYTTLSGFPVCACRYRAGEAERSVFLCDTLHPLEENAVALMNLLDGVVAARVASGKGLTRSDADTIPVDFGNIEDVVVLGKPLEKIDHAPEELRGGWPPPPDPAQDDFPGGCGGSPKPPTPEENDKGYSRNRLIETDDAQIVALLDSLATDCIGQKLIGSIRDSVSIGTWSNPNRSKVETNDFYGRPSYSIFLRQQYVDIDLMEELLHIYQRHGVLSGVSKSRKLNNEIEAKTGWLIYRIHRNDMSSVEGYLQGKKGVKVFAYLVNYIKAGDTNSAGFYNSYWNAGTILRNYPAYRDPETCPFDPDHINMDKLFDLIEDCLKLGYLP